MYKQKKQFILGVGCQKGGTTWLHQQLKRSRFYEAGYLKEYHVFDTLYVPSCNKRVSWLFKKVHILKHAIKNNSLVLHLPFLLESNNDFHKNTDNYFNYFQILSESKNVTTVGDITPGYSALPIEAFKFIRDGFEVRGLTVKVIFLMRDPIERCWSSIRMKRRRIRNKSRSKSRNEYLKKSEFEQLANYYQSIDCRIRTRYENTIKNLEAVFPKEHIHYEFYERLFGDEALKKMQKFLALPDFRPDVQKKINVSKKDPSKKMDVQLRNDIFNFYRETYEFCNERFGIRDIWPIFNELNCQDTTLDHQHR